MSDNTKYKFQFFSMFDYKSIEDYLTSMAAKGWRIERIGAFLWKFKREKPSNKKFSVVFSNSISEFEPITSENQKLLEELCIKKGWEKEIKWKQMQIFCADQRAVPLVTDEAVRLESIHRSMKKTFLPSWIMALFATLMVAFSNGMKYFGNSPYKDELTAWTFLIGLYGAFIAGIALLGYLLWLKASRRKISQGGTCISGAWHRRLLSILLIGFIAIFVGHFVDTKMNVGEGLIFYIIIYMASVLAIISFASFFSQYLKGKGYSSFVNKMLSTTATVVLIIVMIAILNIIEIIMI